jgi:hypothetical protein
MILNFVSFLSFSPIDLLVLFLGILKLNWGEIYFSSFGGSIVVVVQSLIVDMQINFVW